MAYIIFDTPDEAEARSAQAGQVMGYAFWTQGSGTKYHWGWSVEASEEDPRAFIEIQKNVSVDPETEEETINIPEQNLLTDEDELVDELPEDWVTSSETPDGAGDEEEDDDDD
tara:strand:- start:2000 stop:2338 length:339 start_codon:yes stop_codon:yes gene_type:complete